MERQLAPSDTGPLGPAAPSPQQPPLQDKLAGVQSVNDHTAPPCALNPMSVLQNGVLIHQKRLKISASQLLRSLVTIDPLISEYYAEMEIARASGFRAGPDAAERRKRKRVEIAQAINRYDSLLEARRQILEKQDAWLQSVFEVKELSGTDKLLEAINMQIAAAEDLAERMGAREAKKDWKTFKHIPCW